MKINRIEVENFKSIEKYDFRVADFNVFIGQNNHGKTNFFEALSWFDSGKVTDKDYRNYDKRNEIKVRVHFEGALEEIASLPEGTYKTKMQNTLRENDIFIVEKTSSNEKRVLIVDGEIVPNPTGFDAALNYFLPKTVYVTTKQRLSEVAGYKSKSPIAEMLGDVLSDMVDNEPRYQEFLNMFDELFNTSDSIFRVSVNDLQERVGVYLSKQFAEGAEVTFRIENPAVEDMLKKFETEVDDGIKTKAEEKGDGMQRAVILAIVQAYADFRRDKGIARSFLFLIDEAELHLHPTAQRSLKNALRDITESGGQVLISSHSPIFANENFDNQKIFNVEKNEGSSQVTEIITPQEQMDSIYNLLGGSPSDILLPNNFIIVEGKSDYEFLVAVRKRFYSDNSRCMGIKILFAGGDHERAASTMYRVHEAYTPLATNGVYRDRVVFLLDTPSTEKQPGYALFRETYPYLIEGEHLHVLPEPAIEMCYPEPYRKTSEEVSTMRDAKVKVNLAKEVGENITEDQLRESMPTVVALFEQAIEKSYQ
jgi:predicted ATPase